MGKHCFKGLPKLLFIDDVHPESREATHIVPVSIETHQAQHTLSRDTLELIEHVNRNMHVTLDSPVTTVSPEYIVLESEMTEFTMRVIEILTGLSRKKRYKFREGVWWFCSEQKLLDNLWVPTCIWYDVGLTYFKDTVLWFESGVNILSNVYKEQQAGVKRVYQKVNPDFEMDQLYY